MAPSDVNKAKKTKGRQKIEIKKIENKPSLRVAFSKRRAGLFKKADELSILCGAQVAILVTSPGGKIITHGNPALLNPLLMADAPPTTMSDQYKEKKTRMETKESKSWWNEPYEDLEAHELEEYLKALEALADNVTKKADEKQNEEFMNFPSSSQETQLGTSDKETNDEFFDYLMDSLTI